VEGPEKYACLAQIKTNSDRVNVFRLCAYIKPALLSC
jgi:hypothetical protein